VGGGRRIATWKPAKDDVGGTKAEASVLIGCGSAQRKRVSGCLLQLAEESFKKLRSGDELHFRDARDKKRTLTIYEINGDVMVGHAAERAYVLNKVEAGIRRDGAHVGNVVLEVGDSEGASIDARAGDELVLTRRACVGLPPKRDRDGHVEKPGVISCTLPAALDHLEVGQRVFFDDGRIQTVVEHIRQNGDDFHLRVVRTPKETIRLRAEKGINLPDTLTTVPSLTVEDRRALPFVIRHADAVSLSFVRRPEDVRALHAALDRLGRPNLGVVLKIETRAGFENLPGMLLEGLRRPPVAVMIARGDLAVEVGFAPVRDPGGDPLAMRGRSRPGHLGHAGPRHARAHGGALACRGHGRGRVRRRRMRDAEQGALRRRSGSRPRRHPVPDGAAPLQEAQPVPQAAGLDFR
jgi:pyruvate kinase